MVAKNQISSTTILYVKPPLIILVKKTNGPHDHLRKHQEPLDNHDSNAIESPDDHYNNTLRTPRYTRVRHGQFLLDQLGAWSIGTLEAISWD